MRFRASRRAATGLFALTWGLSCTRLDDRAELQQAEQAMQQATGVRPAWTERPEVRELRPDERGVVSMEQAIDLALGNNRALRGDLELISRARADLVQAGLLSNPVLAAMLRLPEGGGRANLDFGLTKDFADLWLIPTRKRAAQAMLQQRILSFTDAAVALVNELRSTYYTLQYQTLAISLQQQNRDVLRQAFELAEARLRAGEASQLDVNLTRSSSLEAELELIQLRSENRVTRQALLRLMGVARAPEDWSPTPIETRVAPVSGDESELIDTALRQRLDVQAANWEFESALADFDQQRLRVIPSLGVGVAGERSELRAAPGRKLLADTARASVASGALTAPDIESAGQRRLARSQEIDIILGPSVEVPLPIFDQNQAQIAKARARARELRQRYEEVEQRVIEGVRSAFTVRRLAEERVKFFRESLLPIQEENLTFSLRAYHAGQETILTVLLAQQALIRTRLNEAAAVRDLSISAANLERQISGRLSESVAAPPETQPATAPARP